MTKEERKKAIRDHLVATWFHGLKGPDKRSKLKPKEQFHEFFDKTTESILNIIAPKKSQEKNNKEILLHSCTTMYTSIN